MKRTPIIVAALLMSGGCAAGTKADDATASSIDSANGSLGNRSGENGTGASAQVGKGTQADRPSNEVKQSPWQPPAEVDPILPPVEGSEPK